MWPKKVSEGHFAKNHIVEILNLRKTFVAKSKIRDETEKRHPGEAGEKKRFLKGQFDQPSPLGCEFPEAQSRKRSKFDQKAGHCDKR